VLFLQVILRHKGLCFSSRLLSQKTGRGEETVWSKAISDYTSMS
jgi:hypothetical protein